VEAGEIPHPMSIDDVWKNSYSENTSRKVWAAKYVARHPNLVALELSSFKCGHDAPIYSVVEEIVEHSGTPYFCFKGYRRKQADGFHPDSRGDHRLLPEALPRRHGA
jgi:predicted nucleotide-binding protein (sugar kinase/HSP70/actin superfamily)